MEDRETRIFKGLIKKTYLSACQVLNYGLAATKLMIFLFATILLLPIYLVGKLCKRIFAIKFLEVLIKIFWSRLGLWLCNIRLEIHGEIDKSADGFACNHISWLDILAIQSILDVAFVAKSDVKKWPFFGFLAKIADTLFIDRRVMAAKGQQYELLHSIRRGKSLFFFPEGTSTDGSYILPFKSSLFEVFITLSSSGSGALVQPVMLKYHHSDIMAPTIFGWWGEMSLILHIFNVVANAKGGTIEINFEETLDAGKIGDRKDLALATETAIKKAFFI